jgi:hypothetical protein
MTSHRKTFNTVTGRNGMLGGQGHVYKRGKQGKEGKGKKGKKKRQRSGTLTFRHCDIPSTRIKNPQYSDSELLSLMRTSAGTLIKTLPKRVICMHCNVRIITLTTCHSFNCPLTLKCSQCRDRCVENAYDWILRQKTKTKKRNIKFDLTESSDPWGREKIFKIDITELLKSCKSTDLVKSFREQFE